MIRIALDTMNRSETEAMLRAGEEGDFEAWLDRIGANYPVETEEFEE